MRTAGIDIGSITAKAAIFKDGKLLASKVIFTGYNAEAAGQKVYDEVLSEADRLMYEDKRRHDGHIKGANRA